MVLFGVRGYAVKVLSLTLLLVSGCEKADTQLAAVSANTQVSTISLWVGRWNGPEGSFLQVNKRPDSTYELVIQDLDGKRSFSATADNQRLYFERDGLHETLHATDGAATGMKWLVEKSQCLMIRFGEAYCRD